MTSISQPATPVTMATTTHSYALRSLASRKSQPMVSPEKLLREKNIKQVERLIKRSDHAVTMKEALMYLDQALRLAEIDSELKRECLSSVMKLNERFCEPADQIFFHRQLGDMFVNQDGALEHYTKALELIHKYKIINEFGRTTDGLARMWLLKKNYTRCLEIWEKHPLKQICPVFNVKIELVKMLQSGRWNQDRFNYVYPQTFKTKEETLAYVRKWLMGLDNDLLWVLIQF
jgi:tetratricopeptide (TPR) repeat protein